MLCRIAASKLYAKNENGEILIDAGKDGISKMHIDEKVPVTMDTVSAVFDNGEDYLLNYVCENEF